MFNPMTHHLLDWEFVKKKILPRSTCSYSGNSFFKNKNKETYTYCYGSFKVILLKIRGTHFSCLSHTNINKFIVTKPYLLERKIKALFGK